jgi:hypothetical protein
MKKSGQRDVKLSTPCGEMESPLSVTLLLQSGLFLVITVACN